MAQQQGLENIFILGGGNFGTCLANHLAKRYNVTIWTRSKQVAIHINKHLKNPKYLTSFQLSPRIKAVWELDFDALNDSAAMVLAIPTQSLRAVLEPLRERLGAGVLVINTCKGIEDHSLLLPSEVIGDVLGKSYQANAVTLSGPSFAIELIQGQPACVSLASKNRASCLNAQKICHSPIFRAYTSEDPIGLEVAGALKNVIAIGAGACIGLSYGQNSLAAFVTRGLAEITRIGVRLGANPLTFNGLGGVGDLFLTCTSSKSRNYTIGYRMGKKERLDDILDSLGSVAEGVVTAKAANLLVDRLKVDAPITKVIYGVLYEGQLVDEAIHTLLNRDPKPEILF